MTSTENSSTEGAPSEAYPEKIDRAVLNVAGVVVLGAIMSILDITVVSVALPTFQTEFDATYAQVAWTMTAYTLALAAVIPATGWAADRFGTKRLYLISILLFTLGSLLCAVADSIGMLVFFRVLQGLGGGMLMPLGMTIMTRAAGPQRIGRLMAVLGVPMMLGPIMGPILGGVLIDVASWHWIFLINLPLGIAALVYSWKVLPTDKPSPGESFDFVGMALLSPGLAAFLFGVSTIPEEGTFLHPKVLIPGAVGLALIVAFVFHAFKPAHPLLDLRLFKNRNLTVAVLSLFVFVIAFMGSGLLFPSYFLQVRGESTLAAGLLMAPQGIGAMLMMPIAGIMADKIPVGRTVPFGILVIAVGFLTFTQLDADTSYWLLGSSLFVMGLGMGSTMMPLMTSALRTLSGPEVARGSTLTNIIQQAGGAVGTAVMSVVLTAQLNRSTEVQIPGAEELEGGRKITEASIAITSQVDPESFDGDLPDPSLVQSGLDFAADAFSHTFWVALALVLVSIVPVLFLPRKREESRLGTEEGAPPVMLH